MRPIGMLVILGLLAGCGNGLSTPTITDNALAYDVKHTWALDQAAPFTLIIRDKLSGKKHLVRVMDVCPPLD